VAVDDAIADAASYRALGLPTIDTTSRAPAHVAEAVARLVIEVEKWLDTEPTT
jgi:hypothetical protein